MKTVDKLYLHKETCEVCKANTPGTELSKLDLCPVGAEFRERMLEEITRGFTIKAALVLALLIGGCVLVGMRLGGDVAVGLLLVALSARIEVFS